MLTRLVRTQLIVFTVLSVLGITVMMFNYMHIPTMLGIGRLTVTLELPAGGGLYRFSNVTYRGVQIGTVTSTTLTDNGAEATLSLNTSSRIPADLKAEIRSVSAVGEQYVDLQPRTSSGPFLTDGAVIPMQNTTIPQLVGPMLDQVSALVQSIPKDELSELVDEGFNGFNGAGTDFRSLLDSLSKVTRDVNGVSQQTRALIDDSRSLLESQARIGPSFGLRFQQGRCRRLTRVCCDTPLTSRVTLTANRAGIEISAGTVKPVESFVDQISIARPWECSAPAR